MLAKYSPLSASKGFGGVTTFPEESSSQREVQVLRTRGVVTIYIVEFDKGLPIWTSINFPRVYPKLSVLACLLQTVPAVSQHVDAFGLDQLSDSTRKTAESTPKIHRSRFREQDS